MTDRFENLSRKNHASSADLENTLDAVILNFMVTDAKKAARYKAACRSGTAAVRALVEKYVELLWYSRRASRSVFSHENIESSLLRLSTRLAPESVVARGVVGNTNATDINNNTATLSWSDVVTRVKLVNPAVAAVAAEATLVSYKNGVVVLSYASDLVTYPRFMADPIRMSVLLDVLQNMLGFVPVVRIRGNTHTYHALDANLDSKYKHAVYLDLSFALLVHGEATLDVLKRVGLEIRKYHGPTPLLSYGTGIQRTVARCALMGSPTLDNKLLPPRGVKEMLGGERVANIDTVSLTTACRDLPWLRDLIVVTRPPAE